MLGNVIQKSTPTGSVFSSYDAAGRLRKVSTVGNTLFREFIYGTPNNDNGKLVTARAYNWRSTGACTFYEVQQDFRYDPNHGRLASEDTTLLQGTTVLQKWTQSYVYDGAGRIVQTNNPNCVANCASAGRTVTTNYAFGRPTSIPGFASSITYNDNGMLATITHANNVLFTETPDPSGIARPRSLSVAGASSLWQSETYAYDGAGNIKQIGSKQYTYDAASRITSATVPSAAPMAQFGSAPYQEFTYDLFGNLTRIARGTQNGSILTYVDYLADPASNHLQGASYDASGSLTAYQGSAYTWDVLQQAMTVNTGSESWVHVYDAAGERVWSWRTSPSRIDNYALRGRDGRVLRFFSNNGSILTVEDYVYREGQLVGAVVPDGTTHHFDVDHLGSVRLETAATPPVYREFWPYGEEATAPGGSERMKFLAGQERDLGNLTSTADDIDYMNARYYLPIYGRFLSVDTLQR